MNSHQEAYFMGRIAAATTHELKNILAIMKETLGLLEDLVEFSPQDASIDQYKQWVKKAVTTVTDQIGRGIALVQHFNRFAHIPDHPVLQINVRNAIQHLVTLCAHIIRLKQVKVEQETVPSPDSDIPLITCPLYFYMAVFSILDRLMSQLLPGSTICLKSEKIGDDTVISFGVTGPEGRKVNGNPITENNISLEFLLKALEARLFFDEKNNSVRLILRDVDPDEFVKKYFEEA